MIAGDPRGRSRDALEDPHAPFFVRRAPDPAGRDAVHARRLRQPAADDFTAPFQKLVTEWCWADTWNRPGLDRKTRSMLNLAMLTALNRPHEIKLHVRGALNNGLTPEQIREVLLHTMVYCGVPATLDAFKAAKEVIDQAAAETKA